MEINLFSSKLALQNNIAILESKIIYFYLRSNFRDRTIKIKVLISLL